MKLNLEYYISKDTSIPEAECKVIENFVEKYREKEYEDKIVEFDSKKLQLFSTMGSNIINWYAFEKNATILEIGANFGEMTGVLCQNASQVISIEEDLKKAEIISKRHEDKENLEIIVGDFKNIDFKQMQFDYITLIGSLPYVCKTQGVNSKEFIKGLDKLLKPNGKLLIAVDNRFGLKNFAGNPDFYLNKKFVTLLNYNNEEEKIETYTRQKLINILNENNYSAQKFYYPLPDYRIPNVIFSDLELPEYSNIGKYIPNYQDTSTILFDEIDVYREILKEDTSLFPFFASSYLVEASKNDFKQQYKFISYNNARKTKYRLITKIADEYVDKECVDENSKEHYENIIENINNLRKRDVKVLDEILENKKIKSKYINQEYLLSNVLNKKLENEDLNGFYDILDKYYELIKKSSEHVDNPEKTVFEEYFIEISEEDKNGLYFLKDGLWDMTLKNCFYIDNEFYFFDQEWKSSFMPAEYILYRSIMYTISLRRFINVNEILKKYGFDRYLELFQKLDEKLQEEIREDRFWEYFNQNRYFNIDETKQEMINMQIRSDDKDKAIEYLQNKINTLENERLLEVVKRKAGRWIRRKK